MFYVESFDDTFYYHTEQKEFQNNNIFESLYGFKRHIIVATVKNGGGRSVFVIAYFRDREKKMSITSISDYGFNFN